MCVWVCLMWMCAILLVSIRFSFTHFLQRLQNYLPLNEHYLLAALCLWVRVFVFCSRKNELRFYFCALLFSPFTSRNDIFMMRVQNIWYDMRVKKNELVFDDCTHVNEWCKIMCVVQIVQLKGNIGLILKSLPYKIFLPFHLFASLYIHGCLGG